MNLYSLLFKLLPASPSMGLQKYLSIILASCKVLSLIKELISQQGKCCNGFLPMELIKRITYPLSGAGWPNSTWNGLLKTQVCPWLGDNIPKGVLFHKVRYRLRGVFLPPRDHITVNHNRLRVQPGDLSD